EARPGQHSDREAGGELVVAFHDVGGADQGRDVGEVGDVEENAADARDEGDNEELSEADDIERERDRYRGECDATHGVGKDHQWAAAHTIDEHAGEQGKDGKREALRRDQQADEKGGSVKAKDRERRQCEDGDLGADDADRLPRPELEEIAIPPEPAASEHKLTVAIACAQAGVRWAGRSAVRDGRRLRRRGTRRYG